MFLCHFLCFHKLADDIYFLHYKTFTRLLSTMLLKADVDRTIYSGNSLRRGGAVATSIADLSRPGSSQTESLSDELALPPCSRHVWPGCFLPFWTRPPRKVDVRSCRLQPSAWLSGRPCRTRLSSTNIWQCLHDHGMKKEQIEGIICFNWVYTTNHHLLTGQDSNK